MPSRSNHPPAILSTAFLAIFAIMLTTFTTKPASVEANSLNRLHPKTHQAALEREVDFPYYSLREGFDSTLRLVNDSPLLIAFSIRINSLKGKSLQSSTLTITPNETLGLDLRKLLGELKGNIGEDLPKANTLDSKTHVTDDFAEGSVSIHYQASTMMPLLGQITITNPDLHLSHESYMVQNNPEKTSIPSILNTTWWGLRPGRDANIAISNTSDERTTPDMFLDFQGRRHTIRAQDFGPHETKVLSVTKLLGELDLSPSQIPEGGITIINRGLTPALIAQGWILDASNGFSTTLDFPSPRKPNTLYASGVPIGVPSENSPFAGVGTFTPHVIIRNLADSLQQVAVVIEYPGQNGTEEISLPPSSMQPYSTTDLAVDSALAQLPRRVPHCSFRIQYDGPPASVIAQLSSVEEKSGLVIDSRVVNERVITRSGGNPWHLDPDTESVLFLTSTSEKEVGVALQIYASGVKYHVTDMSLKPHEIRAIDIRKLRDEQKPDFLGNRIPADAKDGVVFWLDVGEKPVAGRLVVFHRSEGTASNYDCGCQCGDFGPPNLAFETYYLTGGTSTLAVGGSTNFTPVARYDDCNSNIYYFNVADSWDASPPSVGAVDGAGHVTTQSPGVLTVRANYAHCSWTYDVDLGCQCPYQYQEHAPATINVSPTGFTIAVTSTPIQGETNSVVSGQSAQVRVTVLGLNGATATSYTGSVHFSSTDTGATLPADYTYTSSDAGVHTFNVTLKTVSGTSATRDLTVKDNASGVSSTQNINLWFQVTMDVERWQNCGFAGCTYNSSGCAIPNGSYNCTVASGCGPGCTSTNKNQPQGYASQTAFVALPYAGLCPTGVNVKAQVSGVWSATTGTSVGDIGPGSTTNNYWNTGAAPPTIAGCLSDKLATNLGVPNGCNPGAYGQAAVLWRFQ